MCEIYFTQTREYRNCPRGMEKGVCVCLRVVKRKKKKRIIVSASGALKELEVVDGWAQ